MLKEKLPGVRCVAGEPAASPALSSAGPFTGHRIEGTGPGFAPANFRRDLADAVVAVSDADAHATAKRLAREEGIFGGISSGANVWIALQRAQALAERRAHRDRGLRFRPEVSPGRPLSVVSGPDPSTRWLSCHVDYACRHSGACCRSGWPLPVETGVVVAIDGAIASGRLRTVDGESRVAG